MIVGAHGPERILAIRTRVRSFERVSRDLETHLLFLARCKLKVVQSVSSDSFVEQSTTILFLITQNIKAATLNATQVEKNIAVRRRRLLLLSGLHDFDTRGQVWRVDV